MSRLPRPLQALLALCALSGLGAGEVARADEVCDPARVEIRGPGGRASIRVEVADDVGERAQGLMFVEKMPQMSGMLFVYEVQQPVAFWMKNTLIPLDMIFFDETGKVINVHANARPHDLTPIPSAGPARFVLELNGGMAKRLKIDVGSEMRHPTIPDDIAAWPCK